MITLDVSKPKTLTFSTTAVGIDPAQLQYTFRVVVEGIEYGFNGKKELDKVVIKIPALTEVIKSIKPGKYKAKVEVTGQDKYYMCPFNESVEIVAVPKVSVKVEEAKNEEVIPSSESNVKMSIVEQEDGEEVKNEVPVKKSRFAQELIDKLKG